MRIRLLAGENSVITGHMEEDSQVAQEIAQWCRAVSVKKTLAGRNLGLLGRPYEGSSYHAGTNGDKRGRL